MFMRIFVQRNRVAVKRKSLHRHFDSIIVNYLSVNTNAR